jgi:hypothetical protein
MKKLFWVSCFVILGANLFAGASAEGGGSNRGTFLSRGGYIIRQEDIKI